MAEGAIRLLIIDDSADDAFAIERQLKKAGMDADCLRVDDPAALQQALREQTWDIALCDIKMPLLNPQTVLDIMAQTEPPEIPIILMSGVVDIGSLPNLIRGGVRDFLPKDELNRLAAMVQRELEFVSLFRARQSEHAMFVEAQKMEAVGTLAGGVAHDFNNILTALIGLQWKLKSQYPDLPPLVEKVDKMDELCHRAADLVKQLLGFARKGIIQVEPIELGAFMDDNMSIFRMSVSEDIELQWQRPDAAQYISADSTQLQQMLINLINNARDAAFEADQACIRIAIEACHKSSNACLQQHQVESDNWLCLSISNNGAAIPEEIQAHIFEPFFTTKAQGKGTGLGLAMVYGTMQSLDGFVDVVSDTDCLASAPLVAEQSHNEGMCTQFSLFFPVEASAAAMPSVASDPQQQIVDLKTPEAIHILIADDEDMVRDVIDSILSADGYQVKACADGQTALRAFESEPERYHVIILDVVMPHMGGPEVAKAIRLQSNVPIILVSGYDIDETLALVEGVADLTVLTKPFVPSELLGNILNILQRDA